MVNKTRVLFVCLGNICRSPLAEVVVQARANQRSLNDLFYFESAGTGNWHIGNPADVRSALTAKTHGLDLSQHRAQQITSHDISKWDWFIAMDVENRMNLLVMGVPENRVVMMRQFEQQSDTILDVPDPYYGGDDGFEDAYHMLVKNADLLLSHLQQNV